ncbi:LysR family transcriptional regulator [Komagataeibacter rhaeticus]|uniref:LysR family transcriptional regulator n=1 Tax=Komagataeibacter rhaeticus TaxID=215221 RepID=UPI0039E8FDE0
MLDRITGMQLFSRAMQMGSISAAGRALGLSPGMASRHLDALERRLGVRLCHRSTRRLSLTEAGQHYLELCQRLLPELEEVEARIASQRIEASGVLRFNVPLSFGVRYIAPLIPAFHALHPAVTVDLGLNDRIVDLTGEGWDLTIRIGRLRDSRLVTRRLAACELLVCAAPDYLTGRGRPQSWADLSEHDCLGFSLSGIAKPEEWFYGRSRERRVPVRGPLCANNGDALVACASAGLGIIYEPDFIVADAVRAGRLEVLTLDAPPAALGDIHLLYAPDRTPPAKVRAMIDFLVRAFDGTAPWTMQPV